MSPRGIWLAVAGIACLLAQSPGMAQEPKTAAELHNRGLMWLQKGEADKAIKDFDEAIKLDPQNALAYEIRGQTWNAKGESEKAAKDFLRWAHSKPVYEKWFVSQKGFATPCTPEWEKHAVWSEDPVMEPFKIAGKLGRTPGYAGPADAKSAEALSKYIVTDMYAKAVQGMPAEDAVKWAESELLKVYV